MSVAIFDGKQLDRLEAKLAERAAEAPDDPSDPNEEARAAIEAAKTAPLAEPATPLIEHPTARRAIDAIRPGTAQLVEVALDQIDDVLAAYHRAAMRAVRQGKPIPPPSVVVEDALALAQRWAGVKGEE